MWLYVIYGVLGFVGRVQSNPVAEAFLWNGLVPDILNNTPSRWLSVTFPSGAKAELGNSLLLQKVQAEPTLNWEIVPGQLYTVLFVDPDALSRKTPVFRSFLHWLVVNVPGTNISAGETIAPYFPPQPPVGSGPHRYVFLIYEQPGHVNFGGLPNYIDSTKRISFSVADFTAKYNLGKPYAGNFYLTQNTADEIVTALPKIL